MHGINFEKFEHEVMDKILAGDNSYLAIIRKQYEKSKVISREFTGVGFFSRFQVQSDASRLRMRHVKPLGGDVLCKINGKDIGFVLFFENGLISCLEGFTYTEAWPKIIKNYELTYISGAIRDLASIEKAFSDNG